MTLPDFLLAPRDDKCSEALIVVPFQTAQRLHYCSERTFFAVSPWHVLPYVAWNFK